MCNVIAIELQCHVHKEFNEYTSNIISYLSSIHLCLISTYDIII